ncbi:MAG: ATP-binding cassette domain-containing protein, partial [Microgenomates group bacterium]
MIIFEAVTKQFPPDESGVRDVSFEIEPGELVLLTGPSGSGKTTLIKLLLKEYVPESGSIHFEDSDLTSLSAGQIHNHRRKIGVVFQNYRLLPELNIWENIALPLWITGQTEDEIENRVTDLLELVNLPDKAHLFPHQISGGEAQRISIARALANAPSVILADEPTGN